MAQFYAQAIFYYHLLIGEVWTIRNETTYPIHGKYPLSPNVSNLVDKCGQHCWQLGAALSNSFRFFYFILPAFEARRLAFLGTIDTSCRRDCSLHFLKWLHTPHHRSGGRCWHRQGQQSHTGLGGGPFAGGQERTMAIMTNYRGSWLELSWQLARTIVAVATQRKWMMNEERATAADDDE